MYQKIDVHFCHFCYVKILKFRYVFLIKSKKFVFCKNIFGYLIIQAEIQSHF